MTQEQKDKIDNLMRCSIYDIVRVNKIQDIINEGIMKSVDKPPKFQDLCSNILPHMQ